MTDMLEDIFRMQGEFDDYILRHRPEMAAENEVWVQRLAVFMMTEAVEMLESTDWAWWRNPKGPDWKNIKTELADWMHVVASLAIRIGMTAEDFHMNYRRKNIENFYRQQGKSERKGYEIEDAIGNALRKHRDELLVEDRPKEPE